MVIVFIGPPGSGKGTQAQILKNDLLPNLHLLTVSSLLKEKSDDGSVLGNDIKNKMDNGDLIDDTIVISVLKEKVDSLSNEQILIDGFPRSSSQADSLKDIFKDINILEHAEMRPALSELSGWPTFPQLFVKGELLGGCDITVDMHQNGTLLDALDVNS